MKQNLSWLLQLFNPDITLTIITSVLMVIGSLCIFSTTYTLDQKISSLFINQIIFYVVGFLIMLGITVINYEVFTKRAVVVLVFALTIISLILVLQIGEYVN